MDDTKQCRLCGATKPLEAFYRADGCRDGRRGECIECFKQQRLRRYEEDPSRRARDVARSIAWAKANPERRAAKMREYRDAGILKASLRKTHLKQKYGLTPEDYERMLEAQGGGCAVCGRPPRPDISLHVDHDHETGEIRGLLCFPCNLALGQLRDDPERMLAMVAYLAEPPARGVLGTQDGSSGPAE